MQQRQLTSINGLDPQGEDSVGPGRAHIEAMPSYMPVMLALPHIHTLGYKYCFNAAELCVVVTVHAVETRCLPDQRGRLS